jgi:homogentisate 1,2-dioxygenase
MNQTAPITMIQSDGRATHPGYMPGFGNDFETEALPGGAAAGMNSPQKCNYGLYAEQLSGTAFTARAARTNAAGATASALGQAHRPVSEDRPALLARSAPDVDPDVISLGQYRWDPVPHPTRRSPWLTGMRTMTTAGDVNTQVGMARISTSPTPSMEDAYFYSADSELLVVPQEGRLRFAHRARHHRPRAEGDRHPAARHGLPGRDRSKARRAVSSARTTARSSICRARADRRQLHGQPARFPHPVAAFEDREVPSTVTVKWCGQFHAPRSATARSTWSPGTATTRR